MVVLMRIVPLLETTRLSVVRSIGLNKTRFGPSTGFWVALRRLQSRDGEPERAA